MKSLSQVILGRMQEFTPPVPHDITIVALVPASVAAAAFLLSSQHRQVCLLNFSKAV